MRKLFIQFLSILVLFFGSWLLLGQIDWMRILKLEQLSQKTEEKLGELYWNYFKNSQEEILDDKVYKPIDSIFTVLCDANGIDRNEIKLHILENKEVNAFALPGKQIILFSGLISDSQNEAELAGVLGHELAHIQEQHITKKLIKEVGLSVLISTATGGNGEIIRQSAKVLSSSAYDRSLEKTADKKAIDYLEKADLPLKPMANFLLRMEENSENLPQNLVWVSTHPDGMARVDYIHEYIKSKSESDRTILSSSTWSKLQDFLDPDK